MSTAVRVVLVTCESAAQAESLAEALVGERLAACVNVVGPIRSIYRWQGEIQHESEYLLVIKTAADRMAALDERIRQLHTYETPEILALPVDAGSAGYLDWLLQQVQPE